MTDPAIPPPTATPAPERPDAPEAASPAVAPAAPAHRPRPTRRIAVLVGVALVTTIAIVALVALVRPGSAGDAIAKGQPVPEIRGTTLDGAPIDLASLRGHPVIVNFWGPSCVPCREEMPLLARKAKEHAGSGLQILGVLMYDSAQPARDFTKHFGGTWPTVVDPDGSIRQAYRVIARPQSYFIDKDGILRSIQIGYLTDADFERQLAMISGGG